MNSVTTTKPRRVRKPVGIAQQIPRNSLALLMVAQLAVLAPLALQISPWIVGVCLICGYWRTQVYRGRWGFPPSWVKFLLVVASFVGLAWTGYRSFTLEAATSLLVLAFALKLVEMKSRRDAYLVIYLSYFLVANAFLFSQPITLAAYEMLAITVVTAALIGMNQMQSRIRPLASMWTAARLVLQALPFTLILFVLFPRIGPLWSIPMPSSATTGLSDRLTPGDIANLSQSDELAFRAIFEDEIPAPRDLYWRGLVYSEFAYGTWAVAEPLRTLAKSTFALEQDLDITQGLAYQVFLEPTQSRWLYSLDVPIDYGRRINMLGDYRLVNHEPVLSVRRYDVISQPGVVMNATLSPELRQRETALPPADNPRIRAYAKSLLAQSGGDVRLMIATMLQEIRASSYRYTLSPPRLDRVGSVDAFWFDTQAGFCTHYAGAMVFALRAVGIPARMVGGYQGGEINPVSGHLVVRQYQAHAWVEVWLEGQGWTRYDPTAAVAPQRVENGLNAALSEEDRNALSLMSAARMGSDNFFNNLLDLSDSIEHRWNLWVVGYDATVQSNILQDMLGSISPMRIGIAIVSGGAFCLLIVAIGLFWRRSDKPKHPVEKLLRSFTQRMHKIGQPPEHGEPPQAYVRRLASSVGVNGEGLAVRIQDALYNPDQSVTTLQVSALRQDLRKLQFRLAIKGVRAAS